MIVLCVKKQNITKKNPKKTPLQKWKYSNLYLRKQLPYPERDVVKAYRGKLLVWREATLLVQEWLSTVNSLC